MTSRVAIATIALILAIGTIAGPTANAAGTTGSFAVLAGTAVDCTTSTIDGDVGIYPGTAFTPSTCVFGTVHAGDGVAQQAVQAFLAQYARLAALKCDDNFAVATLASRTFTPGVYCFDAALTLTNVTLTLEGPANGSWIFKIGTGGTGALTSTNSSVVMAGAGNPCNVTWWTDEAATITDSEAGTPHPWAGSILAGTAISMTGAAGDRLTFAGNAFAKTAVTMTDVTLTGCEGSTGNGHGNGNGKDKQKCNQGVGNGPELCDPGNSNQGDPSRSNDELGGTPGNPGRRGGNK
ncbi:MAG: ice-binding family protein [Actinomycetota bacterium]